MMETLATNTMRALALIVSDAGVEQRVREEIREHGIQTPEGVDKLDLLEGCVQEAMRLWPTTPMLMRQTLQRVVLGGNSISSGTQVVIPNGFAHRDWETNPDAGNFRPDFWLDKRSDYRFNHLSNGTQACAGKSLALFIAKAVLANLLVRGRYILKRPKLNMRGAAVPVRRFSRAFRILPAISIALSATPLWHQEQVYLHVFAGERQAGEL